MELLTDVQAAARLCCSASKIRRLRREGHLAFIPGRPVRIDAADLAAYVAGAKVRRGSDAARELVAAPAVDPRQAAAARAQRKWLLRRVQSEGRNTVLNGRNKRISADEKHCPE